jgi:antitoxin component YwqK of YwqJK toxin-antitoxin module
MSLEFRTGVFQSGAIKYEKLFFDDKPYGTWRIYQENGKLIEEFSYDINGKLNGLHRKWHHNGILFTESFFKNDLHHGITREWYENGNISYEANYEEGEVKGISRRWSQNGTLLVEKFYCGTENGV